VPAAFGHLIPMTGHALRFVAHQRPSPRSSPTYLRTMDHRDSAGFGMRASARVRYARADPSQGKSTNIPLAVGLWSTCGACPRA